MLQLWTAIPLGDLRSGCGYMLRLTKEGTAIAEGERGVNERLRLATRLVAAEAQLERTCVVHPWASAADLRKCGTVGKPAAKLLADAEAALVAWRRC